MTKRERHGKTNSSAYRIWQGMRARCANPKNRAYKNYGGRGIDVCHDWQSFNSFYADMGDPPDGMTLERLDNDKGYSKANCQWSPRLDQNNNKRNNMFIAMDSENLTLSQWCRRYDVKYITAYNRIVSGWTPERAIKTPETRLSTCFVVLDGEKMTLRQASEKTGIAYGTLKWRRRLGKTLFAPVRSNG
jgi:hypothetical protein